MESNTCWRSTSGQPRGIVHLCKARKYRPMSCATPPPWNSCNRALMLQSSPCGLDMNPIETTHVYLEADLDMKRNMLAKTTAHDATPGRYKPADTLLAFLKAL